MEDSEVGEPPITPAERRMVYAISAGLILVFLLVCIYCWTTIRQNKLAEDRRIQAIIDSPTVVPGASYDTSPPAGTLEQPVEVETGLYLNQIPSFSMRDSLWMADFYIWFSWQGAAQDPGETFSIVDSTILSREKIAESHQGDMHYTRYHVTAQIYKYFDVSRFPFSETILTIPILDAGRPVYALNFTPDEENSGLSSRVDILEGVDPTSFITLVKLLTFDHAFNDPALPPGYKPAHSTFIYALWVSSPGLRYYLKLFLAVLVSGLIAIAVFFIKPTDVDPRFGLGVGALFAASATAYVISSAMPPSGGLVLADMVSVVSIMVIYLSVLESILSLYLYDIKGRPVVSRLLDKLMFVIFLVGFLAVNIAIPLAAIV